jgi:hypothetical protein
MYVAEPPSLILKNPALMAARAPASDAWMLVFTFFLGL